MAGKKPAKLATDAKKQKPLLGRMVMFVGLGKDVTNECPQCGSRQHRGMVREYNDKMYCSESCVQRTANVS